MRPPPPQPFNRSSSTGGVVGEQYRWRMWPGNNKFCCNGRLMFGKDLNSFCVSNVLIAVPVLLFLLLRLYPRGDSPYAFSLRVSSFVFCHLPAGIVCADSSSRPFSVLHSGCDVCAPLFHSISFLQWLCSPPYSLTPRSFPFV